MSSKVGSKLGQLEVTSALDNYHTRHVSGGIRLLKTATFTFEGMRFREEEKSKREALLDFQNMTFRVVTQDAILELNLC